MKKDTIMTNPNIMFAVALLSLACAFYVGVFVL
jgi:hypothetical protein